MSVWASSPSSSSSVTRLYRVCARDEVKCDALTACSQWFFSSWDLVVLFYCCCLHIAHKLGYHRITILLLYYCHGEIFFSLLRSSFSFMQHPLIILRLLHGEEVKRRFSISLTDKPHPRKVDLLFFLGEKVWLLLWIRRHARAPPLHAHDSWN